ncbi:hypothetical protein SVIOM74S_06994 [Streptomyces violarus]
MLTVNGRVGFVELGCTCGSETTVMMSGACPPPAPSVWYAWMPRPPIAASVSPRPGLVEGVRVDGDLDAGLSGDGQRGVDDGRGRAPVLVQLQSECAARICDSIASWETVLPLPSRPMFSG